MKLESSFKNMFLSLTGIALVVGFLLSAVYILTKDSIEDAKQTKQREAITDVLPEFDRFDTEIVNDLTIYKAYLNNKFVGAAVESFSQNGFSGEIRIMVGFDAEGNIFNYNVLEQKETPGLGTKITDWFKTPKNDQSIIGKNPEKNILKVKKDGGEIDAITASTISSRAFLQAVVLAYNAYANNSGAPDANTSASLSNHTSASLSSHTSDSQKVIENQMDSIKKDSIATGMNHKSVPTAVSAPMGAFVPKVTPAATTPKVDATTQATSSSWEEPKPAPVILNEKKQNGTIQQTDTIKTVKEMLENKMNSLDIIPNKQQIKEEMYQKTKKNMDTILKQIKDTTNYE